FRLRTEETDVRERTVSVTVTDSQGAESPAGSFTWKVTVAVPPAPDLGAGTLSVEWNDVVEDVDGNPENLGGYRVYLALGSEPLQLRADVGSQTEATLTNLERGSVYDIAVSAYDHAGNESELSETIQLLVP